LIEMHVADRVMIAADAANSIACVGLDPRPSLLPPSLRAVHLDRLGDTADAVASAFVEFNLGIIPAVAGHCAAVKPQTACYEAYGSAGWEALRQTIAAARSSGVAVIVDAKRGDIGSTAEHYAQTFFGGAMSLSGDPMRGLGADWLTVNSYLGSDAVYPFLADDRSRGVFVLVKTSNPSSDEIQGLRVDGGNVAEAAAQLVHKWGIGRTGAQGMTDVGAVIGATFPDDARKLRSLMPNTLFLVPGYGAQGADATSAVAGARPDGTGVIVSASRSIASAWQGAGDDDWAAAARAELDSMNTELFAALP
jgi:orotidine-5'-phosphate decarboxylase